MQWIGIMVIVILVMTTITWTDVDTYSSKVHIETQAVAHQQQVIREAFLLQHKSDDFKW